MEAKKDIRKCVLDRRNSLSKKEWEEKSHRIIEKLTSHPFFLEAAEVYCYIDFRNEVKTRDFIEQCWKSNKKVAVPKIEDEQMKFYYISSWDDVAAGFCGIYEPHTNHLAEESSACIVMPGAVFDQKLNRIGYGGGYYDKYLQNHPNCQTIALAFALQIEEQIPCEMHDVRPQIIITEEQIYA